MNSNLIRIVPLALVLGACGGNDAAEPETPQEEDTTQQIEEAGDAVGDEIEGAAEDAEETMEDAVDDEDAPDQDVD